MGPRDGGRQAAHAGVRGGPQQLRPHGAGRLEQDQERDRPLAHLQEVLQGGHLRILRHEHW